MKKLLIIFSILLAASQADAAYWYVRDCNGDSSCGTSAGTSWTNPFDLLSGAETVAARGDTIFVADGSYTGVTFNTAVNGTATITIKKAVAAGVAGCTGTDCHGSDTGWLSGYGDGQAVFPSLSFNSSYWVFDGVTGGGPTAWTTGFGFKVYNGDQIGNQSLIAMGTATGSTGANITIKHVDIGNSFQPNPGCDTGIYSSSLYNPGINNTISYVYIHDTGDMGMMMWNATGWTIEYSKFKDVANSGLCDGICCTSLESHGTGIEVDGTTEMTFRYNYVSDIRGTGFLGYYGSAMGMSNVKMYGNFFTETMWDGYSWGGNGIFYSTSGSAGPLENNKIYNNTFAGLGYSIPPSLSIFGLQHISGTNEMKNNLFYGNLGEYNFASGSYATAPTMDYNAGDQASKFSSDTHFQTLSSSPFVNIAAYNFSLSTGLNAGASLASPYNVDMMGNERGSDGIWDRGALEYGGIPYVPPDETALYTIGGTISGLGSGLTVTLQNNGGDDLARTANGTYSFVTSMSTGSTYNVTVSGQPTGQTCSIASGATGTVSGSNVTNVNVTCNDITQCSDGTDNDGDGLIDYPDDPDCSSANDDDESEATITPAICTAFTYSAWGVCQPDGTQTRTVLTSSPAGCAGGGPVTTQSCTYTPSSSQNNPPTIPVLVSPANGATGLGSSVEFRWKKSTDPDGDAIMYHLYNCADQSFTGCAPVDVAMNSKGIFYYCGAGLLVIGMTFIGGSIGRRKIIFLLVIVVLLAGGVFISCGKSGDDPVPPASTPDTTLPADEVNNTASGLTPGATYYWKVVADDGKGGATESAVWSYGTQ